MAGWLAGWLDGWLGDVKRCEIPDLLLSALGVPSGVTAVCSDDSEPGLARLLYLPISQSVSEDNGLVSGPYLSLILMLSSLLSELAVFLNFALSARSQQAQPRQPQHPPQSPAPDQERITEDYQSGSLAV